VRQFQIHYPTAALWTNARKTARATEPAQRVAYRITETTATSASGPARRTSPAPRRGIGDTAGAGAAEELSRALPHVVNHAVYSGDHRIGLIELDVMGRVGNDDQSTAR
jgi:hypothetical protein